MDWVHKRTKVITAVYLTKDPVIDWRVDWHVERLSMAFFYS